MANTCCYQHRYEWKGLWCSSTVRLQSINRVWYIDTCILEYNPKEYNEDERQVLLCMLYDYNTTTGDI